MSHATEVGTAPVGPIGFRPLSRGDFQVLHRWLNDPHVRAWWPREPPDPAGLEGKYGPRIDGLIPVRVYIIEVGGEPAGMVQCFRWADRPQRKFPVAIPAAATIDFLLGEAKYRGKGIASPAFAAFVRQVFVLYPDVDFLIGYPHQDNHAFQRVLEKAGYRRLVEAGPDLGLPKPPAGDSNVVYVLPRAAFRLPGEG